MTGTDTPTLALVICANRPGRSSGEPLDRRWDDLAGWTEVVVVDGDAEPGSVLAPDPGVDAGPDADGVPAAEHPGPRPGADVSLRRPLPVAGWWATRSEHLVFVPEDCIVAPDAFDVIHDLIVHNPGVDFAYFDSTGYHAADPVRLAEPHHRPGYSPDRLRAQMYLGDMFLVSRPVAEAAEMKQGAPHATVTAPPTHESVLTMAALSGAIAHVPRMLYRVPLPEPAHPVEERRPATAPPSISNRTAGQRILDETGFPARVRAAAADDGILRFDPEMVTKPSVSIIMPTNGSQRSIDGRPTVLCLQAIDSVIAKTSYPDYELVLVVTPGAPPDLAAQVLSTVDAHSPNLQPTIRFCRDDRPFNFANACNRGAVAAAGEFLVFLNDDTVVDTENWLQRLTMYGSRPDIGAVGARLHYGNGRIQHAGIWTRGGHPSHRYERFPADHPGYMHSLLVPQNCLAVTGACLGVANDKFRQVGGFSPEFPSSFNDVDLCLKLDDLGYRTVVDPEILLTHYEASSRDPKIDDWELALLHERWRSIITDDPYDNPHHLAPRSEEYPAPDPFVTEQKRLAGLIDFMPRVWPRPRLTAEPIEEPVS